MNNRFVAVSLQTYVVSCSRDFPTKFYIGVIKKLTSRPIVSNQHSLLPWIAWTGGWWAVTVTITVAWPREMLGHLGWTAVPATLSQPSCTFHRRHRPWWLDRRRQEIWTSTSRAGGRTTQLTGQLLRLSTCNISSPVSIQTQSLALASSQSWLPLLRPSIPISWRLRLFSCGFRLRNARNASDCVCMETGLQCSTWPVGGAMQIVQAGERKPLCNQYGDFALMARRVAGTAVT